MTVARLGAGGEGTQTVYSRNRMTIDPRYVGGGVINEVTF